jgi:hypothetical protein
MRPPVKQHQSDIALTLLLKIRSRQRDANRLRRDGLRWIPLTSAKYHIPVVSIHTLGDGLCLLNGTGLL